MLQGIPRWTRLVPLGIHPVVDVVVWDLMGAEHNLEKILLEGKDQFADLPHSAASEDSSTIEHVVA